MPLPKLNQKTSHLTQWSSQTRSKRRGRLRRQSSELRTGLKLRLRRCRKLKLRLSRNGLLSRRWMERQPTPTLKHPSKTNLVPKVPPSLSANRLPNLSPSPSVNLSHNRSLNRLPNPSLNRLPNPSLKSSANLH